MKKNLKKEMCGKRTFHIQIKKIFLYNLDMILAVGYRVNSKRGILFRKWATSVLKQYMITGYSINNKRCIECQDNLLTLNNKVEYLSNQSEHMNSHLFALEKTENILIDKLFYEDEIFDAYSYIKHLFISAKSSIIIIDGYVDLSVLDMLSNLSIPITIYTYPSSTLTQQDIDKFSINHNLTIIKTNKIHDRLIIIDDTIYLCSSSIKDVGKKRFVLTKLNTITKELLLENI